MDTPITDLKTNGFVTLSYPGDLRRAVENAAVLWKNFCALPMGVKRALPYSNNAAGVGYELKDGSGHNTDKKENFDVALGGKEWVDEYVAQITHPCVLEFVRSATALVPILKPIIVDFARRSEEALHLGGFEEEVAGSVNSFFVRFIHYFGDRKPGEVIATPHADQSGFTPHLFESSPGLQRFTFGREWTDMPVSFGETVIIPAMQMQLRSRGQLKALCHRVIATPETAHIGRYSAVCFVQLKRTPKYDKERCGRLQEKSPGFNYDLSHEDFRKLFKE